MYLLSFETTGRIGSVSLMDRSSGVFFTKKTDESMSHLKKLIPLTEEALRDCALAQEGVLGVDMLNTRMFGARVYVDIEIRVDGELKLVDAHEIAERVHDAVESRFPEVKHVMVHVNPA